MSSGPHPMPTQNAAAHAAQVAHNAAMAAHAAFQQHSAVAAQAAIVAATGMSAGPVPFMHHRRISQENVAASGLSLPPNVIRLPRGPDKNTKGFQRWCKSRMVNQAPVEEPKPRFGVHKRGSHAVAIVAPPKEDKSKAPQKKVEEAKDVKVEPLEKKVEIPEKEEVKEAPEPSSSISGSVSVEPSAPTAEDGESGQAQAVVNVPVVQGRIIIAADSDTCSDSGNDSEPDQEAAAARAEAAPQAGPPSFAARMEMENGDERSR